MNSKDRAEAAGGCDEDGTALLAVMGLDGPPPAQASAPAAVCREAAAQAKRNANLAFVFYSENWQALIFFGQQDSRQPGAGSPDGAPMPE